MVYRYTETDLKLISDRNLDLLIRGGSGILKGDVLSAAKRGILSFHHGDNDWNRGGPAGFWEVFQKKSTTGFVLQLLTEELDGGKILFHTKSHFTKLIVFTIMMLIISFINIKFWFSVGYLAYLLTIGLLFWTYFFGIKASGSQRWIDLYFINLQPSELMKIFIILCLAKYFHRMKLENVNSIYAIFTSLVIILLPMGLVIIQPDLGTSVLIAISGIAVLWFAGINHKYFIYTMISFLISLRLSRVLLTPSFSILFSVLGKLIDHFSSKSL